MRSLVLSWFLCVLFALPARAEVLVFAAASLAGPLDRVAEAWEEAGHGAVTLVYAGSSALARQVEAGAPADLVFLANAAWMDHLAARGAIDPDSRRDILGNRLVVIAPAPGEGGDSSMIDTRAALSDPAARYALALTGSVPAGIYARAALEELDLWGSLAPRVVEADNVRAATRLVAIGAVPRGIVYETEALAEPRVTILAPIAEDLHPPIRYPAALTIDAAPGAAAFLAFFHDPVAACLFRDAGFQVLPE
jgi:molybdate transport system substrate-binding protein